MPRDRRGSQALHYPSASSLSLSLSLSLLSSAARSLRALSAVLFPREGELPGEGNADAGSSLLVIFQPSL